MSDTSITIGTTGDSQTTTPTTTTSDSKQLHPDYVELKTGVWVSWEDYIKTYTVYNTNTTNEEYDNTNQVSLGGSSGDKVLYSASLSDFMYKAGSNDTTQTTETAEYKPPVAALENNYSIQEGATVTLDASASTDPNGSELSFLWDLNNDGKYDDASGSKIQFSSGTDGNYQISLLLLDKLGQFSTTSATVTVADVAPIADAGGPYTTDEGSTITLDASASRDLYGDTIVEYRWDFDGDGEYDDATGATSSFSSKEDGIYNIGLQIKDSDGSISTTISQVTVRDVAPIANAGGSYTTDEGTAVILDASSSHDLYGDSIVEYSWDFDGDGDYDDAEGVNPTFFTTEDGTYNIGLQIKDSDGSVSMGTSDVVVANVAPTANAGNIYTAFKNEVITLDASLSTDPGNDIVSYEWSFDEDNIFDATGVTPIFQNETGEHKVTLTVTDNDGASSEANAIIYVGDTISFGNGSDISHGTKGNDILMGGNGEDNLSGDMGTDRLYGGNGNDTLSGGTGDDWLTGGRGNDSLLGGEGNDMFYYGKSDGYDTIIDFEIGDMLDISPDTGIMNFHDLGNQITSTAAGINISIGDGGVFLTGVTMDQISESSFIFG